MIMHLLCHYFSSQEVIVLKLFYSIDICSVKLLRRPHVQLLEEIPLARHSYKMCRELETLQSALSQSDVVRQLSPVSAL